MLEDMVHYLARYYGFSEDSAREVVAELRSTESLKHLAGYGVARAVTPPNDLAG